MLKACAGAFCCRKFWLCLSMPRLGAAHHLNHLGLTSACMALQLRPRAAGRDARCARARGGSARSLSLLLPAPRGPACEDWLLCSGTTADCCCCYNERERAKDHSAGGLTLLAAFAWVLECFARASALVTNRRSTQPRTHGAGYPCRPASGPARYACSAPGCVGIPGAGPAAAQLGAARRSGGSCQWRRAGRALCTLWATR